MSDEKKSGRRCERRAQSVVVEKQSVRDDGKYSRSGIWDADFWKGKTRVSRISLWSVKISFLFEGATALCGMVMFLSSQ